MPVQKGEKYRCENCGAEVEVTKSGTISPDSASFEDFTLGESAIAGDTTSPLACCNRQMERVSQESS